MALLQHAIAMPMPCYCHAHADTVSLQGFGPISQLEDAMCYIRSSGRLQYCCDNDTDAEAAEQQHTQPQALEAYLKHWKDGTSPVSSCHKCDVL